MENFNGLVDRNISTEEKTKELKLPDGTELPYQIAGHRFGNKNRLGILKHSESGDILKPICDKRGKREQLFYETIFSKQNDYDFCICPLRKLVPHYNGLFHDNNMNIDYIRLQDITMQMSNVSLLDIKMGCITYDPEATEEKRRRMNKYPYAKELGFRILGMKFYDQSSNEYIYKNKDFGLQLNPENAFQALVLFTQNDVSLLKQIQEQLNEIEMWFTKFNIDRWKFISSSLLLAYGNLPSNQIEDGDSIKTVVKMIDFAHVFPNVGIDENYLFGLTKLKFHLKKAIDSCAQ